ncbi:quinol oxidase [Geobacter grbiciae]|uniref:quinol oxidase n=1 Tax=Geobacter grbiciae TaxID=155042 RepID=UPI001C02A613|nr:quinol oxidase [Geobacter grbiciae]MBT1073827.1 quinol oxidase [Geobacter grbiciae]
MKTTIAIVMMLAAGSLAAVASQEEEKPYFATIGSDGIQHVEIVGGSYFFKPGHIVVKVNVPVELKVRKEAGMVPHNIAMNSPEAGIVFDVSLGEEPKIVKFTPVKTGRYSMYCDKKLLFFKSHREKGMEGVLEVVE